MICLLSALAVALANPTVEPAPVPSGMDLLYDDHVPLLANGEPIVTLGIAMGETRIAVRATARLRVDFYEEGVFKQAVVPRGTEVEVRVHRAQAAHRNFYVDLEGMSGAPRAKIDAAVAQWRGRGVANATVVEEGTVLGMGGRVLDNRSTRLVMPVGSAAEAARGAAKMSQRFGVRATAKERLAERPWGELSVGAAGSPLGLATSYVRFTTDGKGLIEVADVESGQGYSWHGRSDRQYRDEVYAVIDPDGKLAAVNAIGAESILKGVVPAEIYATSPAEALKAQAVAARNTLVAKLGRRHFTEPFHLCSEQHCQVYAGVAKEDPRTTEAVRATAGQVLFYRGKVVDAVYSSNCGGHTEDNDAVWGDAPNPALRGRPDFDTREPTLRMFAGGIGSSNIDAFVRMQPPSYCAQVSRPRPEKFRWQRTLQAGELQALVERTYPRLGPLRGIELQSRGHGGRLTGLRLVGANKSVMVNRELPIRQLFGNLNSAAFTLQERRDANGFLSSVTFTGGGWGHGVGLCQLGAIGRAEAGQSYEQILGHYYNGAGVERLYGSSS